MQHVWRSGDQPCICLQFKSATRRFIPHVQVGDDSSGPKMRMPRVVHIVPRSGRVHHSTLAIMVAHSNAVTKNVEITTISNTSCRNAITVPLVAFRGRIVPRLLPRRAAGSRSVRASSLSSSSLASRDYVGLGHRRPCSCRGCRATHRTGSGCLRPSLVPPAAFVTGERLDAAVDGAHEFAQLAAAVAFARPVVISAVAGS